MRFTWLTYRAAIRRAFRREYQAFQDHSRLVRGPDPWYRLMRHTNAIRVRESRERMRRAARRSGRLGHG